MRIGVKGKIKDTSAAISATWDEGKLSGDKTSIAFIEHKAEMVEKHGIPVLAATATGPYYEKDIIKNPVSFKILCLEILDNPEFSGDEVTIDIGEEEQPPIDAIF